MTASTKCPPPEQWRKLLDEACPEREQSELQNHLENCHRCREILEQLVADRQSWAAVTSRLVEQLQEPPPETALQRVMADAKAQVDSPTTGSEASFDTDTPLDFLSPSENPDHIGRLGPYEIAEVVGRGGMGIVLKGYDPQLKRVVAIKVLAPELASNANARRRFRREGQAAAAVSHDHVVTIHAVAEANGLPHLVMEYVSGQSLQNRIDHDGPLELIEILRIGMQTASGLAAAHDQGLVHRDIKPANILLENGVERVKITDFGLARAVDDVRITNPGVVTGTPEYMSPEQARGEPVDHRADLFSLGSVLYAMCTGRPPFRAESTMAMIGRVCEDTPRPIAEINAEIPQWLAGLIDKLLAKNSDERFQSASEVSELLSQYLAHLQQPSTIPLPKEIGMSPVRPARKTATQTQRRTWAIAASLLVLLLGGFGFTEATGLTDVATTVIRIARGDGTLVVEVDDPNVEVLIDGEEVVIQGAGPKEIRVRPGDHKLVASKDGTPLHRELVTIARGGRKVVKITQELPVLQSEQATGPRKGTSTKLIWAGAADPYFMGAPSPDGKYLSYVDWNTGDLAVRDLPAGGNRRLTNEGWNKGFATYSVFSRDSKQVAFVWWDNEKGNQLRVIGVDGSGARVVKLDEDAWISAPADWSSDGSHILALGGTEEKRLQILLVPVDGGSIRVVKTLGSHVTARRFDMSLSPDGRFAAYSLPPEEGSTNRDIALVATDEGREALLVEHPADDFVLGWGPDGNRIVFASDRTGSMGIWAIDVADGKPQGGPRLLKAEIGRFHPLGMTQDGSYHYGIFSGGSNIYLAPFDPEKRNVTGKPVVAVEHYEGSNWAPAWSRDGKHLACVSRSPGLGPLFLIQTVETGKMKELAPDLEDFNVHSLGWSPDGSWLVGVGKTADAARWGTLKIDTRTGAVVTIAEGGILPNMASDGKIILYVRRSGEGWKIIRRDLTTGDEKELFRAGVGENGVGAIIALALSPDGKQVAFEDLDAGALKVLAVDGGRPRELAKVEGKITIAWTPDGKHLVYATRGVGEGQSARAWIIPAGGGEPEKLDLDMEYLDHIRFHPDGNQIAFTGKAEADTCQVWTLENFLPPLKTDVAQAGQEPSDPAQQETTSTGPTVRQVWAKAVGYTGATSPDGRYFAYVDWNTGNLDLYEFASEQKRVLAEGSWEDGEWADNAVFSPDGRQVAYCWSKDGQSQIRVINVDGTGPRVLYRGAYMVLKDWSADGKHIVAGFVDKNITKEIALIAVEDGTRRVVKQIDSRLDSGTSMSLSADGRYLAYSLEQEPSSEKRDIFLLAADGSSDTRLVEHPADDFVLGWSPDGHRLIFASDRNGPMGVWVLPVADGKPQGEPQVVNLQIGSFSPLGLTRDGSLYYTVYSGWAAVYVAELDPETGKVLRQPQRVFREFEGSNYRGPDWSADGRYLVACSDRSGQIVLSIHDVQTGKVRLVKPKLRRLNYRRLRWSPDGRWLLGWGRDIKGRGGLLKIDARTGDVSKLPSWFGWEATWAPDGQAIFHATRRGNHIGRRNLKTGESVALYSDLEGSSLFPTEADFKRMDKNGDGKLTEGERFFRRLLGADANSDGAITIEEFTAFREQGIERAKQGRPTPYVGPAKAWTVSADGKRLAFSAAGALHVLSVADGVLREVTKAKNVASIAWTPDARYLLYATATRGEEKKQLWRVAVAGGEPQKLDLAMPYLESLRVHPDGRRIAFYAQAQAERNEVWVMQNFLPQFAAAAKQDPAK